MRDAEVIEDEEFWTDFELKRANLDRPPNSQHRFLVKASTLAGDNWETIARERERDDDSDSRPSKKLTVCMPQERGEAKGPTSTSAKLELHLSYFPTAT
jgi:hypothetical protein